MEKYGSKSLIWFWKMDSCSVQELRKQSRNILAPELRKTSLAPCTACSGTSHAAKNKNLRRYRSSRNTREDTSPPQALVGSSLMRSLSAEATAEGIAGTSKDKALLLPTSISLHLEPAPTSRGDEPEREPVVSSAWRAKSKCCLEGTAVNGYALLQPPCLWKAPHPRTAYSSCCTSLVWREACTLLSHRNFSLGTVRQISTSVISSSL